MLLNIFKYLSSFLIISIFGILFLDYFLIPNYVGSNNEHYLPDLRGEYIEKANLQLKSLGFNTEIITISFSIINTPGTVVKMFPRAFTKVKEGRTITLTIAGKMESVKIPNLTDKTLRNAKLEISQLGIGIDTIIYEYDNQISNGNITFQIPTPGKMAKSSTVMTLGVSRGMPPDYYIVPDVVNLSFRKAQDSILRSGLRIGEINYDFQPDLLNNTVIEQNMTPGMRVSFPASIHLLISIDKKIQP